MAVNQGLDSSLSPGAIVHCRNRDWILLPSDSEDIQLLRPLAGAMDQVVAIHTGLTNLIGGSLPEERIRPAQFPLPSPSDVADAASTHLLWQAARLTLRDGATPFRSLGRVSVRPRIYQFVPLLMALRLDPVRLLIADDVGVGKTIEALLVAREMLDRGEIKRLCVLCPPYLCDQWQRELYQKANLESVIIRSGTINQLDRRKPGSESVYRHYPIQIASIDFVKSDRNRHLFLMDCPEFVIVDEAHGATQSADATASRQQRHRLIQDLAAQQDRHFVLLTATPHSGLEGAFRSLLSLLRPEFGGWDISALDETQRVTLARHFVQRTRADIERDWEGEQCFPKREPSDRTYRLSREYQQLFAATYRFCGDIVEAGQNLGRRQQRVRYWAALALLRCVMSSPAAAVAALENRRAALPQTEEDDPDFGPFIYESSDDQTDDGQPTPPIEAVEPQLPAQERRRLAELRKMAESLQNPRGDQKLAKCAELVAELVQQGFSPILWCRYIATAEYLAKGLYQALRRSVPQLQVVSITSQDGDDEVRGAKLDQITTDTPRILVATDCLSEGINLQDKFNAAIHYDLPWNPNRLEQREGRVDRYGQTAKVVKTVRYFSPDSAIDGIVLDVLLNKAREIHKALGTYVPVPEESETVTEALLQALFLRNRGPSADTRQLDLGLDLPQQVRDVHKRWDRDAERERINRTRYAQRALRPAEVRAELEATDAVLGAPGAVRSFVIDAAQRLNLPITRDSAADVLRVAVSPDARSGLPEPVRFALPPTKVTSWRISFISPTPEGAEYLGRNHPFVAALARFLMEEALTKHGDAHATRCGLIRTRAVSGMTTILLLRVRYLLEQPDRRPLVSEEIVIKAFTPRPGGGRDWLSDDEALRLLGEAKPDANVPLEEKRNLVKLALDQWPEIDAILLEPIRQRATVLEQSYRRVRQTVGLRVRSLSLKPQLPPDLLGLLVLQPLIGP